MQALLDKQLTTITIKINNRLNSETFPCQEARRLTIGSWEELDTFGIGVSHGGIGKPLFLYRFGCHGVELGWQPSTVFTRRACYQEPLATATQAQQEEVKPFGHTLMDTTGKLTTGFMRKCQVEATITREQAVMSDPWLEDSTGGTVTVNAIVHH